MVVWTGRGSGFVRPITVRRARARERDEVTKQTPREKQNPMRDHSTEKEQRERQRGKTQKWLSKQVA